MSASMRPEIVEEPFEERERSVFQPEEEKKKWNVLRIVKLVAWCFMLLCLLGVYTAVLSEGLRVLAPFFGQKVSQFPSPFVHHFANYEGWDDLDCAFLLSLLMFGLTTYATHKIVILLRSGQDKEFSRYEQQVCGAAVIVVLIDGLLFYFGATAKAFWGDDVDKGFDIPMALLTVGYVVILMAAAHFGVSILYPEETEE